MEVYENYSEEEIFTLSKGESQDWRGSTTKVTFCTGQRNPVIPAEFKQLNNPYDDDSQDGGPTPQADLPEVEPIIW